MWDHKYTIFTPTFNRRHTLPAVFESLLAQTYKDFEWIIVDDGSTDATGELVASWQKRAWFPIRYLYQQNSGKHIAINVGIGEARGELFLTLDSDDRCVPTALARLKYYWDTIPKDQREGFSAVTALCMDEGGQIVGDRFPVNVLDSDPLETQYRYKLKGDKWGFQRTDVFRQFPFLSDSGFSFMLEGIVWNAIARRYKTRFINEALLIVGSTYQGHELRLSKGRLMDPGYAKGMALWHAGVLNNDIKWFWHAPVKFLRSAVHYVRFSKEAGPGAWKRHSVVWTLSGRLLTLFAWPAGQLVCLLDRQRTK